jgi:hypothetical protein
MTLKLILRILRKSFDFIKISLAGIFWTYVERKYIIKEAISMIE